MSKRQLRMVRDLHDLPPVELPAGIAIRTFRPGDEEVWGRIMDTGVGSEWTVQKVREQLTERSQFDPEGLFIALLDGEPVGSACAWKDTPEEAKTGMVHMVCVLPEARGRNLGYLLTLRVLRYFRDHGFSDVYLTTDDFRLPAIKAYLRLGFQPDYVDETHEARWHAVTDQLAS